MLSARYLAGCSDDLVRLYSQLESDIITDMVKKLKRLDTSKDSASYQAQVLKEIGALQSDVYKAISKYDRVSQNMILELFKEATQKATENDLRAYKHGERELSENQEQVLQATAKKLQSTAIVNSNKKTREDFANGQAIKVFSGLQRLTMTIADTASGDFVTKANQAYMQVASGAFTYDDALRSSVDDLAKIGVHTVEYTDSGHLIKRTIEGAVRANIVTGLNQTVSQITLNNCEELGTSLVEVSAHVGARPDHAEWQGKIYSLNGPVYNADGTLKYADFYATCHPGEPTGIGGINCRHSYYPYFEGAEPMYSNGQLDELKDAKVDVDGQTMTRYDAEQQLRLYERAIRKWKLRAEAEKSAGLDNTDARIRLGEWQRKAQDFCNKTGLRRDYAREYVGTANGKQPRGLDKPATSSDIKDININSKAYKDNLKTAEEILRMDNSFDKSIDGVIPGKEMSFTEADGMKANPNHNKSKAYLNNCQTCVVAYELRRRGYDIEAKGFDSEAMNAVLAMNTNVAWIDRKTGKAPEYIYAKIGKEDAYNWFSANIKKDSRYTIEFYWKAGGRHIVHLYNDSKNGLMFYDPQNGRLHYKTQDVQSYINDFKTSSIKLLNVQEYDVNMNVVREVLKRKNK